MVITQAKPSSHNILQIMILTRDAKCSYQHGLDFVIPHIFFCFKDYQKVNAWKRDCLWGTYAQDRKILVMKYIGSKTKFYKLI